jgi:cysteine-rich repeat protein
LARFWLTLSCLMATACTTDLSVSDGLFYCLDDYECKSGYGCNLRTNTCVLLNELPETEVLDLDTQVTDAALIDAAVDAQTAIDAQPADVAMPIDANPDVSDATMTDLAMDLGDPCENNQLDASETGVDCGGNCLPCEAGSGCVIAEDCDSRVCADGVCQISLCGDGVINGVESCDDANDVNSDDCTITCDLATCGDGIVHAGLEQCDDGNDIDTDDCRNNCANARCGDGVTQEGAEACDDGNDVVTDGCTNLCEFATCGDRFVRDGFEECDDGNLSDSDNCTSDCTFARCGDGFVNPSTEACDDGNSENTDECLNNCVSARCGDGVIRAGVEMCDDGNQVSESCDYDEGTCAICDESCLIVEGPARFCGDGILDDEEVCDDANDDESDACLSFCEVAQCGDGFVQTGVEACDDGNSETEVCEYGLESCEVCNSLCRTELGEVHFCGDGFVDLQEECDVFGGDDPNCVYGDLACTFCGVDCVLEPGDVHVCGDETIDEEETCDDGNLIDGDGCDSECQFEALCGNGIVEPGEDCDLLTVDAELFCDSECNSMTPDLTFPFDFNACDTSGADGPLQIDCDAIYGTGVVVVESGFQHVVVTVSGSYLISASGAQGGGRGGTGAFISGHFDLLRGDVIKLLVGQQGETNGAEDALHDGTGGGGGGSFVENLSSSSLLIAAGGGGGGDRSVLGSEMDGRITFMGGEESFAGSVWSDNTPGDSGNAATGSDLTGFGGCGWYSRFNGESFVERASRTDEFCDGILFGGRGGRGEVIFGMVSGGFGGGGIGDEFSGSVHGGGGGGGYSGGAGGGRDGGGSPGGGGGSYNGGFDTTDQPGVNRGNGRIRIELIEPL